MFADSEGIAGSSLPEIANSLRFNAAASTYASRTPGSAGNRKTWTFSAWVKRGSLDTGAAQYIFTCADVTNNVLRINLDGTLTAYAQSGATVYGLTITSNFLRDPSAWYHLVFVLDSTNATAADRLRLYYNGVRITTAGTNNVSSIPQNADFDYNQAQAHCIGKYYTGGAQYLDGYLSNVTFIDGQALTPSSFAYTDPNGQWRSLSRASLVTLASSGGTNSFFLPFDNTTSTTTLGYDASSKGNNFTLTNMVRDGSVNDCSSLDTPTNNWNVWNAVDKLSQVTLANGNIDVSWSGSSGHSVCSTIASSGDKVYYEAIAGGSGSCLGIARQGYNLTWPGNDAYSYGWRGDLGQIMFNGSAPSSAPTFAATNVLMIAIDFASQKMWCGVNGTWYNSGNPAAGTNPTLSGFASDTWKIAIGQIGTPGTVNTNFGQRPVSGGAFDSASGGYFRYTPPSGFKALCRKNLPTPAIPIPNKHFDVVTRNGTGGATSVLTNLTNTDLVWTKVRNAAYDNFWFNTITGAGKYLYSNSTFAEQTDINQLSAFNSNGFSLGSGVGTNESGKTFVDWCFNMGGTTVTNTNGSLTSQVRANAAAGMSVVTWTGTGANATVGHGLGKAPTMIIVFCRSNANSHLVYHASIGNTKAVYLDLTQGTDTNSGFWNNTSPTSSVFSVGSLTIVNGSGYNYVAYCFTDIPGFLKTGSSLGNNSTDGWFANCGFLPRWLLIKDSSAVGTWMIIDSKRDTYNVMQYGLAPNNANAESTYSGTPQIDFVSNGFKIRANDAGQYWGNKGGSTYIWMAIAETPFIYSNAR